LKGVTRKMEQTDQFQMLIDMIRRDPQTFFNYLRGLETNSPSQGTDWSKFMTSQLAGRDDFMGKGIQAYNTYNTLSSPEFAKGMGELWGGVEGLGKGIGTAATAVGSGIGTAASAIGSGASSIWSALLALL